VTTEQNRRSTGRLELRLGDEIESAYAEIGRAVVTALVRDTRSRMLEYNASPEASDIVLDANIRVRLGAQLTPSWFGDIGCQPCCICVEEPDGLIICRGVGPRPCCHTP
jgi:hypothetical protein